MWSTDIVFYTLISHLIDTKYTTGLTFCITLVMYSSVYTPSHLYTADLLQLIKHHGLHSTLTTHRFMVSVSRATQPGYRVSCHRASAMLYHGCSLIAFSLTRLSLKSSGARRSADSFWSQTRHLSLALTPSYQPAVSTTSASISTPTSLCRSTSQRLHQAELFLCSASDPQYSLDSQQTCSFVPVVAMVLARQDYGSVTLAGLADLGKLQSVLNAAARLVCMLWS